MCTALSGEDTTAETRSSGEYTATVRTPISRQARAIRSAISPRLAINTFSNIASALLGFQREERLGVLDRFAIALHHLTDSATTVGLHRDHQLHRLDDSDLLTWL